MPVDKGKQKAEAVAVRQLGAAIREARTSKDPPVSQEDIEKALGIDQSTLSRWERGLSEPSLTQVRRLEDELDLPRGWLLVRAGYVAGVHEVETAIAADPNLTGRVREMALQSVRFFRDQARQGK